MKDSATETASLRSFGASKAALSDGAITPRDLLEDCLARIERHETEVRAFVTLDLERARHAADEAAARYRAGRPLSPIDGMPIGIKDIIYTADLPTQMNSPIYRGWWPPWDAACVHALRHAGAVIVGKTVTTEFACGDPGPTRNPHDLSRTPGGSSSGSAAAVGGGMLPAALGTQTRASTIRPASFCGAFGYKPTFGALSLGGVHPVSTSLDHLGVIAASLSDLWDVARQIAEGAGPQPGHLPLGLPVNLPGARRPDRVVHLRTSGWAEIDPDTREAFDRFLAGLAGQGIEVVSSADDPRLAALEAALEDADDLAREIAAVEMRSPMRSYQERYGDKLGPTVRRYLELSDGLSLADYEERLLTMRALQARGEALRGAYDVFVTLSSSGPAPEGFAETGSRKFITPWTVLGGPSMSLPLLTVRGLPLGVQLMAHRRDDATLAGYARWLVESLSTPHGPKGS